MRRTPIACVLDEGGEWIPWKVRHRMAPIRLYADGWIEDDIYQRLMNWKWSYRWRHWVDQRSKRVSPRREKLTAAKLRNRIAWSPLTASGRLWRDCMIERFAP